MQPTVYLSTLASLGVLVAATIGCGSSDGNASAKQACNQTMAARCERTFACGGASALTDMGYGSVAECTQGLQSENCANPTCPAGKSYHADQAQKCADETKAQSCTDFNEGNPPASCSLVCGSGVVAPGSGGAGGGTGGATVLGAGGTSGDLGTGGRPGTGGATAIGGAGGAGGSSGTTLSPLAACSGIFKACGGDPTGTWDIVSACIEGDLVAAENADMAADYPSCRNTFSAASVDFMSGSVTYGAGEYTYDAKQQATETFAYTPACVSDLGGVTLNASVCSSLAQGLNSHSGVTATCSFATNCACRMVVADTNTTSGTYEVSGTTIDEDNGSSYDFCVSGNTMTQRQAIRGDAYGVVQLKKR
jgi:hypothetical protein